jgi:hypothetical protein
MEQVEPTVSDAAEAGAPGEHVRCATVPAPAPVAAQPACVASLDAAPVPQLRASEHAFEPTSDGRCVVPPDQGPVACAPRAASSVRKRLHVGDTPDDIARADVCDGVNTRSAARGHDEPTAPPVVRVAVASAGAAHVVLPGSAPGLGSITEHATWAGQKFTVLGTAASRGLRSVETRLVPLLGVPRVGVVCVALVCCVVFLFLRRMAALDRALEECSHRLVARDLLGDRERFWLEGETHRPRCRALLTSNPRVCGDMLALPDGVRIYCLAAPRATGVAQVDGDAEPVTLHAVEQIFTFGPTLKSLDRWRTCPPPKMPVHRSNFTVVVMRTGAIALLSGEQAMCMQVMYDHRDATC